MQIASIQTEHSQLYPVCVTTQPHRASRYHSNLMAKRTHEAKAPKAKLVPFPPPSTHHRLVRALTQLRRSVELRSL
jgi:hypothetical protein